METILANSIGRTRRVIENGKQWLVAPITSIPADGVLPGSKGPLFYPSAETKRAVRSWDGVPIVVYHPTRNGVNCSASESPEQHIGELRNSKWSGKLQHEAWFDADKTKMTDSRVYDALMQNKVMEISTGLYTSNEDKQGVSPSGKAYDAVAKDHRPDHMAILPDQVGACSVNDGCGLNVNTQQLVDNPAVSQQQREYLNATFGHDWVKQHGFDNKGKLPQTIENEDEEEDDMTDNQKLGLLSRILNALGIGQPKHPKTGQFQGKTEVAAKLGAIHTAHQQPSEDDPDDDGDEHPEIGQGDRPADELNPTGAKADDDPNLVERDRANSGVRQTRNMFPPHDATKQAASASMMTEHPEAHGFGQKAMKASAKGDSAGAAGFHAQAADAHQTAAVEALKDKEPEEADQHQQAAFLHMKAAAGHSAACTTNAVLGNSTSKKRTRVTRNIMVPQSVIDNCKCQTTKVLLLAHNAKAAGSNADVTGSGKTDQAGGEEDDDEVHEDPNLEDGEEVGGTKISAGEFKTNANAICQQLFGMDARSVKAAVQFTANQEKAAKRQLIQQLTANIASEAEQKAAWSYFAKKDLPELRMLASLMPVGNRLPDDEVMERRLANFSGAGGGPVDYVGNSEPIDNEDQPIPPTINYKELAEENRRQQR